MVEDDRIYGEGINIAARLERLADPGAVCLSAPAWDQVRHKVELSEEDLGGGSPARRASQESRGALRARHCCEA
jgi:class 3 adenylate cyclase